VPGWPGHIAGEHVDVRLTADDGYQAVRSYSIASPPGNGHIQLTVEELDDGEVSPYLVEVMQVGDRLELLGPIGGYFIWRPDMRGPLLLIAGGSGIAPLMSMLRQRVVSGSETPIRLIYSVRAPHDIIYRHDLEEFDRLPGVDVTYTYTREQPEGWTGYRRRIDTELLREVAWPTMDGAQAYVCGPTAFVETATAGLAQLDYPPERIRTERFGPTG